MEYCDLKYKTFVISFKLKYYYEVYDSTFEGKDLSS